MRKQARQGLGALVFTLLMLALASAWEPTGNALAQEPTAASGVMGDAGQPPKEPPPQPGSDSLPLKFVAIVALATAIERFWESIFGFVERLGLAGSKLIAGTAEVMEWARAEQDRAVKALQALTDQLATGAATPALQLALQETEKQLLDAQSRIEEALKSPQYLAIKRAITTLGSLVLGVVLNLFCGLELLKAAGFGGGGWTDWILTGLAIGAGPGPLHSLIKLLEELRGSVGAVGDLARGTAVQKALDSLRDSAVASSESLGRMRAQNAGLEAATGAAVVQVDELRLQRQARRLLRPR